MEAGERKHSEHNIHIKDRQRISVTGVDSVESYNDKEIALQTMQGKLLLKGDGLNIKGLNIEEGELEVLGYVESANYIETDRLSGKKMLKRIFR